MASTDMGTENVDPAEMAKFNGLAARWWDDQGDFRPLHQINPLRLDWIQRHVELDGRNVVDVGCGGGLLTEAMATAGARVTGIDMADGPLAVARLHQAQSGADVEYLKRRAEDLADERPGRFDVVTCLEMLEHIPDPAAAIAACRTLLKPGGSVFFSTINRNPKSFLFAIVGAEYVLGLLPRGTHEYRKFIKPSELEGWAREAGLCIGDAIGLHYNPLSRRYSLGPKVDVNYIQHYVRPDT